MGGEDETREEHADEVDCPAWKCRGGWRCFSLIDTCTADDPLPVQGSHGAHGDCGPCDACNGRGSVLVPLRARLP